MKKIPVNLLRPGSSFTEPVYIEDENMLVPAGTPIREKDMERLKSWGIEEVATNGTMIPSAELSAILAEALSPHSEPRAAGKTGVSAAPNAAKLLEENAVPYQDYLGLIKRLEAVFERISAGKPTDPTGVDQIVAKLIQILRHERTGIIDYILGEKTAGHEPAKNSINTAILSAMIGEEFKISGQIVYLVTGALLHDTGMLRLPAILKKRGGLSGPELQQMQTHPLYSHKIVCREFSYPEEVGRIVVQHHERWDGMGYPQRLAGPAIDLGARIVSVADAFEAMISEKPYRNSMIGYQAMKNLLSDNSSRFDPDVLRAFIKIMGIYPIGSLVLLNNQTVARVVEVRGDAPLRPQIRVLIDETGRSFKPNEGALINLFQEKSLFIARALSSKEIAAKGE